MPTFYLTHRPDIATLTVNVHRKENELGSKLVSLVHELLSAMSSLPLPNLGLILILQRTYVSIHDKEEAGNFLDHVG